MAVALMTASSLPLMAQAQTTPVPDPSLPYEATQDEEPILPDDQFEARLPKVGSPDQADPNAPLPSIDSWIDQQMPQQSTAPVELPPAIDPAEQQELAQPLPPLDSVTVPANVADDNNADTKQPDVRYATSIEGFGKTGWRTNFAPNPP
jgi:translocation and assembly module TamA